MSLQPGGHTNRFGHLDLAYSINVLLTPYQIKPRKPYRPIYIYVCLHGHASVHERVCYQSRNCTISTVSSNGLLIFWYEVLFIAHKVLQLHCCKHYVRTGGHLHQTYTYVHAIQITPEPSRLIWRPRA